MLVIDLDYNYSFIVSTLGLYIWHLRINLQAPERTLYCAARPLPAKKSWMTW